MSAPNHRLHHIPEEKSRSREVSHGTDSLCEPVPPRVRAAPYEIRQLQASHASDGKEFAWSVSSRGRYLPYACAGRCRPLVVIWRKGGAR
jgi:hypothetical protein